MKTTAAVLVALNKPLELADLEIPALAPGQVLVEITYSGVCHTQLLEWQGKRGEDRFLPHCLGHEGSGVVMDVGTQVTKCRPGDRVILSWIKGNGADVPGTKYRWNGRTVNAGGITTFMRRAVVSENRITPQTTELSPAEAAFLGCAVATGLGVIRNTLQVAPNSSVLILGAGGIGLFAIAGAKMREADPIFVADLNDDRLEVARAIGATHLINVQEQDVLEEVHNVCPQGVFYAIEATGQVQAMQDALSAVKPRGGAVAIIGNAAYGQELVLDPQQFNQGKRLLGTWGGDSLPDADFPLYQNWFKEHRINASPLNPAVYPLEKINEALEDFLHRRVTRPLIDMKL